MLSGTLGMPVRHALYSGPGRTAGLSPCAEGRTEEPAPSVDRSEGPDLRIGLPTRRSRSVRSTRSSYWGVRSRDWRPQKGTRSNTTDRTVTHMITHRLVGYDRTGGQVAVEYDVPD